MVLELLAANDIKLLLEINHKLSSHFDMKSLGEPSYVLGIHIICDRSNSTIGLSQKTYFDCL